MSRSWTSYLRHILDEADYLEGRLSGLNRSDFNSDDTLNLIHHYFGVDYDIVWDAATNKAPALKAQVAQILEQAAESDVT